MFALELHPELEARLEELAALTARSKSDIVQEALIEHIDDIEDLAVARQRLIESRARGEKFIPLEQLIERYGMEN
jgi:RHH-type transcriptional regulator, rel operon repressor / antitoxin RelB